MLKKWKSLAGGNYLLNKPDFLEKIGFVKQIFFSNLLTARQFHKIIWFYMD